VENVFTFSREINEGFRKDIIPDVGFGTTLSASMGYKYASILNRVSEGNNFPSQPQDGFDAEKRINSGPRELLPYSSTLLRATSDKHYEYLISTIDQSKQIRRDLAGSGTITQFAVELFDPVNYVGLPFARIGSFGARFLKGGGSVTAVVAGQEAARFPTDPLATKEEVALNLGASFIMGGALTGLLTIPVNRTNGVHQGATKEFKNYLKSTRPRPVALNELGEAIDKDGSIASSVFTDSWLFKAVTTPMKRVLQSKTIPNSVKMTTLKIVNDSGILLAMNRNNQKVGSSVFQNSKQFEGEWAVLQNDLMPLWGEASGKGVTSAFDYTLNISGFEKWLENIDKKSMRGENPADNIEAQVMDKMNNFYKTWETRLSEQGMIGSKPVLQKFISGREIRIKKTQDILANGRPKSAEYIAKLEGNVKRLSDELDEARLNLEDISDSTAVNAPNEINFRPRYFDIDAIRTNRADFEEILINWFRDNPIVARRTAGKVKKTVMNTDDASLRLRASQATDNILGLKDITDPDVGYYGMGKSKHFKHRSLDIPNKLILDYIQTNPVAVMRAYTTRVGPRYEFSRQFNGDSIDDVLDDAMDEMMKSGMTMTQSYAALKDIRHLYKRVVGGVLRDPDSADQTTAKVLRDLATLNFLGSAGLMTLTEPAKIMMEHGIGKTMKALFGVLNDNKLKLAGRELRVSGEGLDNLMNSVHTRLVDELNNNPFKSDIFDKMKNPFFLLNGLGPITKLLKDFDAMVRADTLIDYSVRWTKGKATKMEQEYLLRYNIDLDLATKIAAAPWEKSSDGMYMANTGAWTDTIQFPATKAEVVSGNTKTFAPDGTPEGRYKPAFYNSKQDKIYIDEEYIKDVMWELRGWENPRVKGVNPIKDGIINSPDDYVAFIKMHEIMHSNNSAKSLGFSKRTAKGKADYENAINDLTIKEIEGQPRTSAETVREFRSALSSGVLNTILMGTPADKPIITDGIAYVPMRVAKQFGMKEDAEFKGYARIENGLLSLPFQFYSYSLASVNKVAAAHAHGQLKDRFLGTAISMGLGYMVLQYKTPDWVEMSFQDKLARSFDYSGTAALYSDMAYTAMSTSLALGGPNLTGGFLEPRFPQGPSAIDAVSGLGGAGVSIGTEIATGVKDIVTGNVGNGVAELIDSAPFTALWFAKSTFNEFENMFKEGEEPNALSGFKRY
tara:strand:+ start:3876 stop:7430 length:3555 start_codon:yes stop_codon:yes gene_type:complete